MITFDTNALKRFGIELRRTKTGFILQGLDSVSESTLDLFRTVSADLGLNEGDFERFVEFGLDLKLWSSIKEATRAPELPMKTEAVVN